MTELATIPVVDVREGGTLRHAREGCARARALRDTCFDWFPRAARPFVPVLDVFAKRWLVRSASPYVGEVREIAAVLGFPGIWFLNGSYQWSCTSSAREEGAVPWLMRTLDWPFPGLGKHIEIARMQGPAGEFLNVTWPGYVGALTAMAPGRFAAAINQAPMRRRTHARSLRLFDLAANAIVTMTRVRAIPPDQLLRQAFEQCRSYAEARRMLEETPIARPVIYTLVGCAPGERCVIERTEDGVRTREQETGAANDWLVAAAGWEARLSADKIFIAKYEDATENSRQRREALAEWRGDLGRANFSWITPPVLNLYTRLGVEMCPARGILRAVGYELAGGELPQAVTLPCEVGPQAIAA